MAKFYSTKTYGNDRGLSCAFRQWRSTHSHCSLIHGYSLGFKLIFECDGLDERNWVYDFGGLKEFKAWLEKTFDHTLCVAEDDPEFQTRLVHLSLVCTDKILCGLRGFVVTALQCRGLHVFNQYTGGSASVGSKQIPILARAKQLSQKP